MQSMYYIGLDVHKRTISYCVKDGSGKIHAEGTIPATRFDLQRPAGRGCAIVRSASSATATAPDVECG
jgi:predicted NBD/HSP70 family sugar kinase